MKKLVSFLVVMLFAVSFVVAIQEPKGIHEPGTGIENPELKEAGQGTGQGLEDGEPIQYKEMTNNIDGDQKQATAEQEQKQLRDGTGNQAQAREKIQTGLQNALGKVKNENAKAALERNLNRWMEKYQQRMQRMENVEVTEVDEETGEVEIEAEEPVKYFGFIKGKATKRFTVDKNGKVNEKAPWYSLFYSEDVEEVAEE